MSVFDIECNGFTPTKIHCLSYQDKDGTIVTLFEYDDMRDWLARQTVLIGHKIIIFDVPILERLLGVRVDAELIDTLALSWYLEPDRKRHGLEYYGEDYGIPKPVVDDWDSLTPEEYAHRCEEDVKINVRLWSSQRVHLENLYEHDDASVKRIVRYLSWKIDCAREQEVLGWRLDVVSCRSLREEWVPILEELDAHLCMAMPQVRVFSNRKKPGRCFKQDGTHSAAGLRWFELLRQLDLPEEHTDDVKEPTGWKDPKPSSHVQIKDWLFSHGWEPCTFKYKRDKQTGDVRTIPQVYKDKSPEVSPSVAALFQSEPAFEYLEGRSVLQHRLSIVEGFIRDGEASGYLQARVQGFTNTLRFKHTEVVNLPGIDKPYGKEIRSLLTAPEGMELCGADQCALEDKTKQHFMYPHDPAYVEEMQKDGFDPHLDLAVQAGVITSDQAYEDEAKKLHKQHRVVYKEANYACVYGAGAPTVARGAKIKLKDARKLVKLYWERNWAVKKVAEECEVKWVKGQQWLLNPISRFWYSLRADKDRFSTLNQGSGVYCFDTWVRNCRERGVPGLCVLLGQRTKKELLRRANSMKAGPRLS